MVAMAIVGMASNGGLNNAMAQTKKGVGLTIAPQIGYAYNSGSHFGYGANIGYTHKSGWGVSADYFGYGGSAYNAVTLSPTYKFALDKNGEFAIKVGLGVGASFSEQSTTSVATTGAIKIAGGAGYSNGVVTYFDSEGETSIGNAFLTNKVVGAGGLGGTNPTDTEIATVIKGGGYSVYQHSAHNVVTKPPIASGVWQDVFGHTATKAGVDTLLSANGKTAGFASGTAVEMKSNVWDSLSAEDQDFLITNQLVTNQIALQATTQEPTQPQTQAQILASTGETTTETKTSFVFAPKISFEYNKGLLHSSISVAYLTPSAVFINAGLGVNF